MTELDYLLTFPLECRTKLGKPDPQQIHILLLFLKVEKLVLLLDGHWILNYSQICESLLFMGSKRDGIEPHLSQ